MPRYQHVFTESNLRRDRQARRGKRAVASRRPSNGSSKDRNRRGTATDDVIDGGASCIPAPADNPREEPSLMSGEADEDWVMNNLQAWYQTVAEEPVPDHLIELAKRLDEALENEAQGLAEGDKAGGDEADS